MNYIEAVFTLSPPDPAREIMVAELAETGFESFENTPEGIKAWVPETLLDAVAVEEIIARYGNHFSVSWQYEIMQQVNWNEEWEKNYEPVLISDRCLIRAPFHPRSGNPEFDIVIEPKMSFGTAHHDTTKLMIGWLLDMDLEGKALLDMGCGTGVLAILASLKGASSVTAIDNFEWAWANTLENAARNGIGNLHAIHGDAFALNELTMDFDLILANINKNVLLEDMPVYIRKLRKGGSLLISGFFPGDEPELDEKANSMQLTKIATVAMNQWSSVLYKLTT